MKKSMLCPACMEGTFKLNRKIHSWECDNCDYSIPEEVFDKDYVFWFCDDCNVFLNNQTGFDINANTHICTNCGYENDITDSNIRGICSDCGKLLDNKDLTICPECKQKRREKAQKYLVTTGKIVGTTAVVVGAAIATSKLTPSDVGKVVTEVKDVAPKLKNTAKSAAKTLGEVLPKTMPSANNLVGKSIKTSEPLEKILYTTSEWKGSGKQNYFCNQYRLVGDKIVQYRLNRLKTFDGHENEWVNTTKEIASFGINELDNFNLGWLKKYL